MQIARDHDGVLDERGSGNAVFDHDDGARVETFIRVGEVVTVGHPSQQGGVGFVRWPEFGLLDQTKIGGCDVMCQLCCNLGLSHRPCSARERVRRQPVGVGGDDAGVWDPRG